MADQTYVVKASGVIVSTVDDTAVPVLQFGPVPSNASPEWLAHALSLDLIEAAGFVGGLPPILSGDQTVVVSAPSDEVVIDTADPQAGFDADDLDGDGPIPAKSADKATWVDYAVSKGEDRAAAEASTKDDLIAVYGRA